MAKENNHKRILIFNVNWLGDVLFSTAAIRNIRYNFPDSFIACVIPSRCYYILEGNPHLDEIIIYDEKDRHKSSLSKLSFVRTLKEKKFDKVFLLHRSFSRALICRLAGVPERIGYHTKKRGFLLTHKIKAPNPKAMHRIDYYLYLLEKAGLKIEDRYPEFFIEDEAFKYVEDFLKKNTVKENDFLVAINPGGNWFPKRWPQDYWASLADRLTEELGAKVMITGSYSDISLAKDIQASMKTKPIIACGAFNLKQFGALCKRLDAFITADTGPLHIANTVGAKNIFAIFGPTSSLITGPYPSKNVFILQKDVNCKIPCYEVKCKDNRCMKAITPHEVIEKIKLLKVTNDK
jgi:lipopolysaccharide heptosyltransferase II